MAPIVRTPEYHLLITVQTHRVIHRSTVNLPTLEAAIEDGYIYADTNGNLTITDKGRERLGELDD